MRRPSFDTIWYLAYYHVDRPHHGLGNVTVIPPAVPPATVPFEGAMQGVRSRERLGGLYKAYYREAA